MNQDINGVNHLINASILACGALAGFVFLARDELLAQYKMYKDKRDSVRYASEEIAFDLARLSGDYQDNLATDRTYFGNLVRERGRSLREILKNAEIDPSSFYGILMNGSLNELHKNVGKMEAFLKEVSPTWTGFKLL